MIQLRFKPSINKCADRFAVKNLLKVPGGIHVEHNNRQTVFLAEGCGSEIHHLQSPGVHLVICNLLELRSRRVFFGIGGRLHAYP